MAGLTKYTPDKNGPGTDPNLTLSPADTCSYYSFMTYSFIQPLLNLGNTRPLLTTDLPTIPQHDDSANITTKLAKEWTKQRTTTLPSLTLAIYNTFKSDFYLAGFWTLSEHVCMILQPVFLMYFIKWLSTEEPESTPMTGMKYALLLTATNYVQACIHHQTYYVTMRAGWNLRIALTLMTHDKLLALNSSSASSQGALALNLISTDVFRFDNFMPALWHYLTGPLDAIVILVLLSYQLTFPPALVGILVVAADVILKLYLGKAIGKIRSTTAKLTDTRISQTKELLKGIETVKSYSWEPHFVTKLLATRSLEHAAIFHSQLLKGVNFAGVLATPAIASLAMFGLYVGLDMDRPLTVEMALSSMAFISVLRTSIGKELSRATENGPECYIATRRFQEFFMLPETEVRVATEVSASDAPISPPGHVLEIADGTFAWPADPTLPDASAPGAAITPEPAAVTPCLQNLNLTLDAGELLVVIGAVGAGKTAFINAICNELSTISGGVKMREGARIGLASQQPFVAVGSVRYNLTFAEAAVKPSEEFYGRVVEGCQLTSDLVMLVDGDETMLGERGVNLSGGQRARLGMARAIYSQPDVLLLDDPLAAVDPEVRGKLFQAIRGPLCEKAATVLVTHHSHVASEADYVLVLGEGGVVLKYGTPKECESFFDYVKPQKKAAEKKEEAATLPPPPPLEEKKAAAFVSKETKVSGKVTSNTYLSYFRSGGALSAPVVLLLMTLGQFGLIYSDYFLLEWCDGGGAAKGAVKVYALLVLITVVLSYIRTAFFFRASLQASSSLHEGMLLRVVKAPMNWFHRNPLGRVLNRFSADQGQVDEQLAVVMFDTIQIFFVALGAMVVASASLPYVLIVVAPLAYYIVKIRQFVTASTRELKRFEGMSRSPVYETVTVTMNGLTTIRAFGKSQEQSERLVGLIDGNARAWYWWLIGNRYIGFRLDMVTVVLVGFSSISATLLVVFGGGVPASLIGLSLTYIIGLSGNLQFMVRQSALVENFMTSVERVLDFGTNVEQEVDVAGGEEGGEEVGEVVVAGASMRYGEGEQLVLDGMSFASKQGDKIGICGRTGAGKSSFVNCLLRLNELESGVIKLGGCDISKVSLAKLRSWVTLIPQSPVLFDGTVRYNVDPRGEYSREEVAEALRVVSLGGVLGLGDEVGHDGDNLSVGQQQLLSLARAALRRSKLVVLDEPTANVDQGTDEVIRKMMRGGGDGRGGEGVIGDFSKSTVVTIAHRIQSIVDSDVIVVLGAGKVLEVGEGKELMKDKQSTFYRMANEQ